MSLLGVIGRLFGGTWTGWRGVKDDNDDKTTTAVNATTGLCFSSEQATPVVLQASFDCRPHFYCPNTDASHPLSIPSMCPPSLECQRLRLFSEFCPPQGIYEPQVCPRGFFCPTPKEKILCPEGFWCPVGSIQPRKCYQPFSYCPEGAFKQTFYGGLVMCAVIDLILLLVFITLKLRHRSKMQRHLRLIPPSSSFSSLNSLFQYYTCCRPAITKQRKKILDSTAETDTTPSSQLAQLLVGFRQFQQNRSMSLMFEFDSLNYELPSTKCILSSVNGTILPGRMTVIMGPSGSGKSTLMNVLMGKITRTGGSLRINGVENDMARFRKVVGYVPQDDIMLTELTVRENIAFAAHTRLPKGWPRHTIENFIDAVLNALDLAHVADNPITEISGGQRKRVNIGMELCSAPMCLMVDEPTTGLDATAALKIVRILKRVAVDIGITVVTVIHTPRIEIFDEFDDILLLTTGGMTAFRGHCRDAVPYFASLGFCFFPKHNPADVMMDILSGRGKRIVFDGALDPQTAVKTVLDKVKEGGQVTDNYTAIDLVELWDAHCHNEPSENALSSSRESSLDASRTLPENSFLQTLRVRLGDLLPSSPSTLDQELKSRGASFWHQFRLVHNRSLLQQYRKINAFILEISVACVAGGLLGVALHNYDGALYQGLLVSPYTLISPSAYELVIPALSMIEACAIGLAGAPAAVKIFSEERNVYFREASSGHNRLSYFFGKSLTAVYRFTIAALHFTTLFHGGANPNIMFFPMFTIHLCQFFCVYSFSYCVAMLVRRENAAVGAVCLAMILSLLCGAAPTLSAARELNLGWLLDMSFNRWASEAWYSEELLVFNGVYEIHDVSAPLFGYTLNRFWFDVMWMVVIGTAAWLSALVLMLLTHRRKQR